MSFFKTEVETVHKTKKPTSQTLYFTINSQDTFFQLKYLHNMGYDIVSSELVRFFSSGVSIYKVNLTELESISTWARSIMSYKHQLGRILGVQEKSE